MYNLEYRLGKKSVRGWMKSGVVESVPGDIIRAWTLSCVPNGHLTNGYYEEKVEVYVGIIPIPTRMYYYRNLLTLCKLPRNALLLSSGPKIEIHLIRFSCPVYLFMVVCTTTRTNSIC